jgi:hypothetical protein
MSRLQLSATLAVCFAIGLTALLSASRAVPQSVLGLSWLETEHMVYSDVQQLAYEVCVTGNLVRLVEYSACRRFAPMPSSASLASR